MVISYVCWRWSFVWWKKNVDEVLVLQPTHESTIPRPINSPQPTLPSPDSTCSSRTNKSYDGRVSVCLLQFPQLLLPQENVSETVDSTKEPGICISGDYKQQVTSSARQPIYLRNKNDFSWFLLLLLRVIFQFIFERDTSLIGTNWALLLHSYLPSLPLLTLFDLELRYNLISKDNINLSSHPREDHQNQQTVQVWQCNEAMWYLSLSPFVCIPYMLISMGIIGWDCVTTFFKLCVGHNI